MRKEKKYIRLKQLNKVHFTSDDLENLMSSGDFKFLHVEWVNILVVFAVSSSCQHFRRRDEYLNLFTAL